MTMYSKLNLPETPLLLVEFHGSSDSVEDDAARFTDICNDHSPSPFHWSDDPDERKKLWTARHDALWAAYALIPGATGFATDVCVPISRLADCIEDTITDIEAAGLTAPIVGHVGDGNFHLLLLVDTSNPKEMATAEGINDRLIKRAIEMGGTATGEHGVGYGKLPYMALEHGPSLTLMKTLKLAFDPNNIMNPGKVVNVSSNH